VSVTFVSCVKTNKDIFEIFSPSGSQAIIEFYALVSKSEAAVTGNKNCAVGMLKLEADYRQTRSIARPLCDS